MSKTKIVTRNDFANEVSTASKKNSDQRKVTVKEVNLSYGKSLVLLLLLVVLSASLSACITVNVNNSGIIHPKPAQAKVDASIERVSITAKDGTVLHGYFLAKPNAVVNVVWFGASKVAVEDSIPFLVQYRDTMHANILAMNFRGYGESGGNPDWDDLFSDGLQVFETMRMRPEANDAPIVIHGFSLGSFVGVKVASQESQTSGLAAFMIQGSGTNVNEWIDSRTPWYAKPFLRFNVDPKLAKLDSLQVFPKISVPTLIMSGEQDEQAPYVMSQHLYKVSTAQRKQLKLFPNGTHENLEQQSDYWETLKLFLVPILKH